MVITGNNHWNRGYHIFLVAQNEPVENEAFQYSTYVSGYFFT